MSSLECRVWERVNKTKSCWLWIGFGSKDGKRYGQIRKDGKIQRAHRVVWEIVNGPITVGLNVLHNCDNRACVNPSHLFLGTQRDNIIDMVKKGRCYNRKVTDDEVREIRKSDLSATEASRIYGVQPAQIRKIRSRKVAAHVN